MSLWYNISIIKKGGEVVSIPPQKNMLNLKNYETIEKATENWNEASKIGVRANYRRLISYLSEQGKLVVNEGEI